MKPAPVMIVSGLPRSGTSLLMQMIVAGGVEPYTDGLRTPDDDNPRGYYEHAAVKRLATDTTWLPDAEGKVVKIVSQLLAHVPADLPCRVVFSDRDLSEVLSSQTKMLERLGQPGANLPAEQLRRVYETQLAAVHAMLAQRSDAVVLRLDYANVIADSMAAAEQLSEFLGGSLDIGAMTAVVDPKLYRNRAAS